MVIDKFIVLNNCTVIDKLKWTWIWFISFYNGWISSSKSFHKLSSSSSISKEGRPSSLKRGLNLAFLVSGFSFFLEGPNKLETGFSGFFSFFLSCFSGCSSLEDEKIPNNLSLI